MKDRKYIERIIRYVLKINRYMESAKQVEVFASNTEKVDAVILNLEQIGETAKKISVETRNMYKDIEWIKIIALRNLISHEYEGIDETMIFNIATLKINELLRKLQKLL